MQWGFHMHTHIHTHKTAQYVIWLIEIGGLTIEQLNFMREYGGNVSMYKAVCQLLRALKETGSASDYFRPFFLVHVKNHSDREI